jgi:hypothetical protein
LSKGNSAAGVIITGSAFKRMVLLSNHFIQASVSDSFPLKLGVHHYRPGENLAEKEN